MKDVSNNKKSDEKVEKKGSTISSTKNFIKKLDFSQGLESEKKDSEKPGDSEAETKDSKHESALPAVEDILKLLKVKDIESGKNKLKIIIGIAAGSILILGGIFFMMGSVETVADNVIFGEKAVFSVFLILLGILIIASVLAQKFLNKSFFKGINKEIESDKEASSNPNKKN
ncbi:MAG: hypothetical protein QMD61_07040 [Methanobacterium sp.]|nr:hypothetical protein [Methanobacterium sp.]